MADNKELIEKLEQVTKQYRKNYYEALHKKYKQAKNYAVLDFKSDKIIMQKGDFKKVKIYQFGCLSRYNCKEGKVIVKQLISGCTETIEDSEYEDLDSSDDEWETDLSEELSDDEWESDLSEELSYIENIDPTDHERQRKNSKENENLLIKNFAAVSLDEKTQNCPLSRNRKKPQVNRIQAISLDDNETLELEKNNRTQLQTRTVKQVSPLQAGTIKGNAKKMPPSFRKRVFERTETVISLEVEKKYLKPYDLKECFINLTRLNEVSTDAKCQPLNSEIYTTGSKNRKSKKTNERCIETSREEIIQIQEFNAARKPQEESFLNEHKSNASKAFRYCKSVQEKNFIKQHKSSVTKEFTCIKSVYSVNNSKSLIRDGQFSPYNLQSSLNNYFLEASFKESYDSLTFGSPQKAKRKSKYIDHDEGLPSPKRPLNEASNSITLSTENGRSTSMKLLDSYILKDFLNVEKYSSDNLNGLKDKKEAIRSISDLLGYP